MKSFTMFLPDMGSTVVAWQTLHVDSLATLANPPELEFPSLLPEPQPPSMRAASSENKADIVIRFL
jgi:hypothetical protein